MAEFLNLISLYFAMFILSTCETTTHWFVTEEGRIHPEHDSVFDLRRPYDMVAMLRQETRAASLDTLKQELLERKLEIDANEDKDTGLEARFYKTDDDCIRAGQPLPDFDLYVSTVLSLVDLDLQLNEFINMREPPSPYPIAPSCVEYPLDFSIHAFEHLEGVALRGQVPNSPEIDLLYQVVGRGQSVEDFGHRVYKALNKNQTSWVLYNLAAFYWRVKGNSYESIECLRRSLNFSPRKHADVALLNLANVLHRGRFSSEAAIVLHAALDNAKSQPKHHFTLGNVYAVLGDYNKSSICYENALTLLPTYEAAVDRWHAVLCHRKLEKALENQHKSLQRTLEDLKEYQKRHEEWQQQNDKLISEQAGPDGKLERRKAFNDNRIRTQVSSRIEDCVIIDNADDAERQIVRCSFRNTDQEDRSDFSVPPSSVRAQTRDTLDSLHVSLLRVQNESHGDKLTTHFTLPPSALADDGSDDDDDDEDEEEYASVGPAINYLVDGDFGQPQRPALAKEKMDDTLDIVNVWNWPTKVECDGNVKVFPCHWSGYPSVFLSPSTKGILLPHLFPSDLISESLASVSSRPQPPAPVCDDDDGVIAFPSWLEEDLKGVQLPSISDLSSTPLSEEPGLIEHLREICDPPCPSHDKAEDFLPLLHSALSRPNGSSQWVVYVVASLYWRASGSGFQANVCAIKAAQLVPKQFRDIVLLSFGANLMRQGYTNAALSVVDLATNYNDDESLTHFFLGSLRVIVGEIEEALNHYLRSMRLDPHSAQAFRYYRMLACFVRFKMAEDDTSPSNACIKKSTIGSLHQASEDYLDCKSVELGGDYVQRRCWLKRPIHKRSDAECSSTVHSSSSASSSSSPKASEGDGSETAESAKSCGNAKGENEGKHKKHEKRKYFAPKLKERYPSQYVLEYLDQDVEEVHAKLRKDWFCMDSECNRILIQPRKLPHGLTVRIGYDPNVKEWEKEENLYGAMKNRVEFKLVFFIDEDVQKNIPGDEACFAFGDGSFSHGCTRSPVDLLRYLATFGREELRRLQNAEISLVLAPPGGASSPVAKGAPSATVGKIVSQSRSREEQEDEEEDDFEGMLGAAGVKIFEREIQQLIEAGEDIVIECPQVDEAPVAPDKETLPSDPTTLIPHEARSLAMKAPSSRQCPQIIENWRSAPMKFTACTSPGSNWDFFSSLWLSVQAKGVDVLKHIDVDIPLTSEDLSLKPFCTPTAPSTIRGGENKPLPKISTPVDDLPSIKRRFSNSLPYEPEEALTDFLTLLGGSLTTPATVEEIASRVTMALEQNGGSWVLYNIAALYWRVVGNVGQAIECLRHAITYSQLEPGPSNIDVSDVAYVSLGNVLHRCRRYQDAITVLTRALAVNRTTVMAHLAIANALAAKQRWNAAERFYLSTLFFQPGFRPAETALVVVQCRKMEENDRRKKKKKKGASGREEPSSEENNRGTRGAGKGCGVGGVGGDKKKAKAESGAVDRGVKRK